MAVGRTTEGRTVPSVTTTLTSTALTAPAGSFNEEDAGRTISGTGIPAGATLTAAGASNGAAATLSAAATATGTVTVTLGTGTTSLAEGQRYGFIGWSPETDAESETYTLAAVNSGAVTPDRVTNAVSPKPEQRSRG